VLGLLSTDIPAGQTPLSPQPRWGGSRIIISLGDYYPKFRFSLDGRYVLSQDLSGITVLTVRPFSVRFRVPVQESRFAGFTPDSQDLVFVSPEENEHVERWRVSDRTRVESVKISLEECESSGLSPDGRVLVCLDKAGTLKITDLASGKTFLNRRNFGIQRYVFIGDGTDTVPTGTAGNADIYFSPDGRFVLAVANLHSGAWNLREQTSIQLNGALKHLQLKGRVFVAPDRILLSDPLRAKHGIVTANMVEFPSGKVIAKPKVPRNLYPAADPGFVVVRPFGESARAAAVDLTTGNVIISNTLPLDVFGHLFVAEPHPGEIGLYEIGKGVQAIVVLPKD
jgi:hypothetical protein